jgi:trk system potassium uptake protein
MARNSRSAAEKKTKNEFAVIGLDAFGASLARRLEGMGHTVMGIDRNLGQVQLISDDITSAVALDPTNEAALEEVDIASFGTVIIALEDDFEATTLLTAHLKSLGIPRVICLAETRRHRNILKHIGADMVILSDEDSGIRLAEILATPNMQERVLLDAEHSLTELKAPSCLVGEPVTVFERYAVAVVLIQRRDLLLPNPSRDVRLEADDTLFIVGSRVKLLEVGALQ